MKVVEVLILLCIVSSSVAILISQPCESNVHAVRHAEDLSNVRDTCLCPPPNDGHQVADFLIKQKSDLERVVVFYYRDKRNDEVYMYTPNGDKQLVIPELQCDAQDDLVKIDNQVTLLLFDSPANAHLQSYYSPNYDRHRYHQHTKRLFTHLPKVNYNSPYAWDYQNTWFNRVKPDGPKSNVKVDNADDLSPYVLYSPSDKTKWPKRNKKLNYRNEQDSTDNADYAQAPNTNSYDFDKWYSQSVIQFPELYSGDAKYITFNDFREHLLRIFNEHGYSIINNQVLDPQGEMVDSSNYSLVRVKIKQENDEEHLSPEVEGVMIMNMFPMTILGVVPLTNNFPMENRDISDDPVFKIVDEITEAAIDIGAQASGTKKAVTNETSETGSTTKPKAFNNLLNNVARVVNRLVPNRRESYVDYPGYRIIGGSAATGSGAPISSRGRSGTPH